MCEEFNIERHGFLYNDYEYFAWFAAKRKTIGKFKAVFRWKGLHRAYNPSDAWDDWNNGTIDEYPPVTRAFLNHLSKPTQYPILDINVWKAMINIDEANGHPRYPTSWERDYLNGYRTFFSIQCQQMNGIDCPQINGIDEEIVRRRVLDRALWEYGRLLNNG